MESKTSVADYIDGRLDLAAQSIQLNVERMKAVSVYIHTVRKETEHYGKAIQKALSSLKQAYQGKEGIGNWEAGLNQVIVHTTEITKAILAGAQNIETQVADPLDTFITKYDTVEKNIIKESKNILKALGEQKGKVKKSKDKYHKNVKVLTEASSEEHLRTRSKSMNESRAEYTQSIQTTNSFIDSSRDIYNKDLEKLKINEESKIEQLKGFVSKFYTIIENVAKNCVQNASQSNKTIEEIKPALELKVMMPPQPPTPGRGKIFEKEVYIEHEVLHDNTKKGAEGLPTTVLKTIERKAAKLPTDSITEVEEQMIQKAMGKLLENEPIPAADLDNLALMAQQLDGRKTICNSMSTLSRKMEITNPEVFNAIQDVSEKVLTACQNQKTIEAGIASTILALASYVALPQSGTTSKKKWKYLREMIADHGIWRMKDLWPKIVDFRIARAQTQYHKYLLIKQNKGVPEKEQGGIQKFISGTFGFFSRKPKDPEVIKREEQEEASKKGMAYHELSGVSLEMALISVDNDLSRNIIINYCVDYNVDRDKLYQILLDYESAFPLPREEDRPRERLRYSLSKRESERKRYGRSKQSLILGMSFNYINDAKTLENILLVNKEWNSLFKLKVYKSILILGGDKIRLPIWKTVLNNIGLQDIYLKLKKTELEEFKKDNKYIDDVIRLDVIRSFHMHSEEIQASIMDVLRCYALLNPEVEYCQGMNCVVGLIYLMCKDEPLTFNMFSSLIAERNVSGLFKQDVPMLRKYFYQMNRLIAIYLPQLHIHLFEEGINSTYFCSPWFLTFFTYILQCTKKPEIPHLLYLILDGFITSGFKSIFQTSLFILSHFEDKLLTLRYEQLVQFLGELPKTDFYSNPEVEKQYIAKVRTFNINQELLDKLEKESKYILYMSKELINTMIVPQIPFKHHVTTDKKFSTVYFLN